MPADEPTVEHEFPRAIGRPARSALVHHGLTTYSQLAALSRSEVLALHGVGPKAVDILAGELAARGLGFRDEDPS